MFAWEETCVDIGGEAPLESLTGNLFRLQVKQSVKGIMGKGFD